MKVSIVIPNWNGVQLLKKHLPSVVEAAPGAEIIVSDDCSSDGSVRFLRKQFPTVRVVTSSRRRGFSSSVNAGVRKSKGGIIVLINTDVEPEKDFLPLLLTHFRDPDVFAVGCLERSHEKGTVVSRGRGVAHWKRGYYIHERGDVSGRVTAWVSGGSGSFRRSMWDRLGGMDTLFDPFYWEDIDLSYRAWKAGWKILFEPQSIVHHYHEEGKIQQEFTPGEVKKIAYRNQFIFIWKNATDLKLVLEHIVWTPIRLVQSLVRGDVLFLQGFLMALGTIPTVMKHRRQQAAYFKMGDAAFEVTN